MKEITPDLHTAGRLTERQIKYAADCGVKSIVSLYTFPPSEIPATFGDDPLPTTEAARAMAEDVSGLKFFTVHPTPRGLDPVSQLTEVGYGVRNH
jgi:hypothetical protein